MSGGVKHNFPLIRKLLFCDSRPTMDGILNGFIQIIDGEI